MWCDTTCTSIGLGCKPRRKNIQLQLLRQFLDVGTIAYPVQPTHSTTTLKVQVETHRQFASTQLFTDFEPGVANTLDISLQPPTKILKHGRSTRQYYVLVQWPSHINRAVLNDCVNNFWYGRREIGVGKLKYRNDSILRFSKTKDKMEIQSNYLWVKENLWS